MYQVIAEFSVGNYRVLKLNNAVPLRPYKKYKIGEQEFDIVPLYDLPNCIAIASDRSFLNQVVEFI